MEIMATNQRRLRRPPSELGGPVGTELVVDPLGAVRVTACLHRGVLFDVYGGEHRGRAVALKTPALLRRERGEGEDRAFCSLVHSNETNVFGAREDRTELVAADLELRARLLTVEAQRIRDTEGAWNHEVIALGVWDPSAGVLEGGPRDPLAEPGRHRPVMVMPLHPGVPLERFDARARRELLPRMLPALWDALGRAPHGDLSPRNLICDLEGQRFVLVDPGVVLSSSRERREGFGLDESLTLFTTNAEYYPLCCPSFDFPPESSSWSSGSAGLLRFHLCNPMQMKEDVQELEAVFPYELRPGWPTPSDLQALGVMLYTALAGRHPLYGTMQGWDRPRPIWLERFTDADLGRPPKDPRWRELARMVAAGGFAPPSRFDASVTPQEDALCLALLGLRVSEREQVVALAREASAQQHE